MRVLITGGAGFIGTHLSRRLLAEDAQVSVLDNFSSQVHGQNAGLASDVASRVQLFKGDIRDRDLLSAALKDQKVVVHLAAETGTGQSMYQVTHYQEVNVGGTALLFDILVNDHSRSVRNVVVASSRAIYGEGAYECLKHGRVYPQARSAGDMKAGFFEPRCPMCSASCSVVPTDETAPLSPSSFYGLTKQVQEQMTLMFCRSLGISGYALRYQNVYGPGQSLTNPYTGILAIFSGLARSNDPINVFEDGRESRDFVYVEDVVEATLQCMRSDRAEQRAFNVGSGVRTSVSEVVDHIIRFFDSRSEVKVTGAFRQGDIRHNVADLSSISARFGYTPHWNFGDGLKEFLEWAVAQQAPRNARAYETSLKEMTARGLMHG